MARPGYERFLARLESQRGLRKEAEADVEQYRGLTEAERAWVVKAVCQAGWAILSSRPDRDKVLAYRDPLPESSRKIWARLQARYRGARGHAGA